MPLISVVVPTHNRPNFLVEALTSVRMQTFADYEIIVISDAEAPENRIISAATAARFHCRYFAADFRNASKARNFGIEQAKGEWIAFLDDDDVWLPSKLDRQIAEARRTDADLIACDVLDVFPDGREIKCRRRVPEACTYVEALSRGSWWGPLPSAVMLRKAVFDSVQGFDPGLCRRADSDLWRRISWRHVIFQMDEILLRHRIDHRSISNDPRRGPGDDLRLYLKTLHDTPQDLKWALPNPATLLCRWFSNWYLPVWLRQPRM